MAVVMVLYQQISVQSTSVRTRRVLWLLLLADPMAAIWMSTAGAWLDRASPVTAVVTLGGHHQVVLWLAVAGFSLLAALALLTDGFTTPNRRHRAAMALAAVVSAVALAGPLSVLGLVVLVGLLLGVVGRVLR